MEPSAPGSEAKIFDAAMDDRLNRFEVAEASRVVNVALEYAASAGPPAESRILTLFLRKSS